MPDSDQPIERVLAVLLGPRAAECLGPAAPSGGRLRSLQAVQVLYRPQRRVTVTYDATFEWLTGRLEQVQLVAATTRRGPPKGASVSQAGGEPVGVWRSLDDPRLPGLGAALDPEVGLRLLEEAGLRAAELTAKVRAYRPGSRAVVELRPVGLERPRLVFAPADGMLREAPPDPTHGLFLKVLRPRRAAELADVHLRLAPFVPVAEAKVVDDRGILQLGALAGRTLGAAVRRRSGPLPEPWMLLELFGGLARSDLPLEGDYPSDERLGDYLELLSAVLPEERARLERLTVALSGAKLQPPVVIHGDFHEGNILVRGGEISGLLDLDDAGGGELVDDLGLLVGRVWALSTGSAGERARLYADELLRSFDEVVDPGELRRRVGVALVGRATGPFRNQVEDWRGATRRRLELAEEWVASVAPSLT